MRIKIFKNPFLLTAVMALLLVACSKMEDSYKDFIKNGETIYTGRVDSVNTYPGNKRILLTMLLLSDPKISAVKVYWNNRGDSAIQNIVRGPGVDTVKFMLNDMPEGTYAFEIYTFDDEGHSSIKTEKIGTVYGENYINSLFNRSLRAATYDTSAATLIWYGPSNQTVGEEIEYTDSLGNTIRFIEPVYKNVAKKIVKDTTILKNFTKGGSFTYRTLYKPVPNSLDTFYSDFETNQVF